MPYETARLLADQSYQHWISQEFLSYQWFIMAGVLAVTYTVWFKLVDTKRITQILLLGSLITVAGSVANLYLSGFWGFWQYKISLTPSEPTVFAVSYTIIPIFHMLVFQYTSSWKSYLIWASIATGFLAFILLPVYSALGIFQLHKGWNYIYHFAMMLTKGIVARWIVLWLASLEQRHD
jgi:hypothetical protein